MDSTYCIQDLPEREHFDIVRYGKATSRDMTVVTTMETRNEFNSSRSVAR
jgi:hypothetical protein